MEGKREEETNGGLMDGKIEGGMEGEREGQVNSIGVSFALLANAGIEKHRPLMMEQLEENTCLPEYWGHYKPVVILGMPVNSQGDFNFWLWCTSLVLQ